MIFRNKDGSIKIFDLYKYPNDKIYISQILNFLNTIQPKTLLLK
jgi:hypothetical protein